MFEQKALRDRRLLQELYLGRLLRIAQRVASRIRGHAGLCFKRRMEVFEIRT